MGQDHGSGSTCAGGKQTILLPKVVQSAQPRRDADRDSAHRSSAKSSWAETQSRPGGSKDSPRCRRAEHTTAWPVGAEFLAIAHKQPNKVSAGSPSSKYKADLGSAHASIGLCSILQLRYDAHFAVSCALALRLTFSSAGDGRSSEPCGRRLSDFFLPLALPHVLLLLRHVAQFLTGTLSRVPGLM